MAGIKAESARVKERYEISELDLIWYDSALTEKIFRL
jgi:hypothetical protein